MIHTWNEIKNGKYDFADFGCSTGGMLKDVGKMFPALRGIGIDIDQDKLTAAEADGLEVSNLSILDLEPEKVVKFVTMSHFLEHLNSFDEVRRFINKAVDISTGFVLIKQPFFDADAYLFSHGLKAYWSDWTGHRNGTSTLDFFRICRDFVNENVAQGFTIYWRGQVKSSSDECVIPIYYPENSSAFNGDAADKSIVEFSFPFFKEILILIYIDRENSNGYRKYMTEKLSKRMDLHKVYDV